MRLSVPNALDFSKTCVIRHKNPPTEEAVGGLSARTPRLERITGIEPASSAWEAGVLPINYIRIEYILSSFPDFVNTVFEKILQSLSDKML